MRELREGSERRLPVGPLALGGRQVEVGGARHRGERGELRLGGRGGERGGKGVGVGGGSERVGVKGRVLQLLWCAVFCVFFVVAPGELLLRGVSPVREIERGAQPATLRERQKTHFFLLL